MNLKCVLLNVLHNYLSLSLSSTNPRRRIPSRRRSPVAAAAWSAQLGRCNRLREANGLEYIGKRRERVFVRIVTFWMGATISAVFSFPMNNRGVLSVCGSQACVQQAHCPMGSVPGIGGGRPICQTTIHHATDCVSLYSLCFYVAEVWQYCLAKGCGGTLPRFMMWTCGTSSLPARLLSNLRKNTAVNRGCERGWAYRSLPGRTS